MDNHNDQAEDEEQYGDEDLIEVIDLDEEEEGEWADEGPDDVELEEEEHQVEKFETIEGIPTINPAFSSAQHDGSVFSLDYEPVNGFLVSGGEDDKAFLSTIEGTKYTFEGHKDSVIQVGISHDKHHVFSADMSGLVKVWKVADGSEIWSTEISEIKVARWHPKANVLFAGCEDGSFFMWQIPSGQCKFHQFSGNVSAIQLFSDGTRVACAFGEGSVAVFSLKDWKVSHLFSPRTTSQGEILALDISHDDTLVAAGNVNGWISVMHSSSGKVLWETQDPTYGDEEESNRSIESVAFCPTRPWLAVGGLNGKVSIFDLNTNAKRATLSHPKLESVTKMAWLPNGDQLLVSHLNGALSVWDARTGSLSKVLFGDQEGILDFCLSADGTTVAAGSDDGKICVFKL